MNETTKPTGEGWGIAIVMSPVFVLWAEVFIGWAIWGIQTIQCGDFDFSCVLGGTIWSLTTILMHYPPLVWEAPMLAFLIMMVGIAIFGDH